MWTPPGLPSWAPSCCKRSRAGGWVGRVRKGAARCQLYAPANRLLMPCSFVSHSLCRCVVDKPMEVEKVVHVSPLRCACVVLCRDVLRHAVLCCGLQAHLLAHPARISACILPAWPHCNLRASRKGTALTAPHCPSLPGLMPPPLRSPALHRPWSGTCCCSSPPCLP